MKISHGLVIFLALSSALPGCEAKDSVRISEEVFQAQIDKQYATEVAIKDPNGRFIYLKQTDMNCSGTTYSKGILTISLDNAIGVEWLDGVPKAVDAFSIAGDYQLYVSDNLETELENSYSRSFQINHKPKKATLKPSLPTCILHGKKLSLEIK